MQRILSVKEMRDSDAATIRGGIPGRELMYRAGVSIVNAILAKRPQTTNVGIVCGTGNNAGDGYVMALLLTEKEIPCTIFLTEEKFSEDGKHYFDMCLDRKIRYELISSDTDFSSFDLLCDCIYGTGFHGTVGEPTATVIKAINDASAKGTFVVSVDINSGLNGNTGMTELCVQSDLTVSVGSYQPGHFLNMAKDNIGKLVNCPIGIAPIGRECYLFDSEEAKKCLPERKNFSNKGTYGYVALIGGSIRYSGAIRLAAMANASMRSGAGVVSVAVPKSILGTVATQVLESTLFPLSDNDGEVIFDEEEISELIRNRKTIAFGMGIGKSDESKKILEYLLSYYEGTLIVDADGLNCLAEIEISAAKPRLVLTPHIKEFSRLTGKTILEIQNNPVESAEEYARLTGAIVLLKGPSTIITDGEKTYIVNRGCAGMATAGSGDVLSGILAAVCSYNKEKLLEAVAAGAYINGLSGELAEEKHGDISMIAGDTVEQLENAIKNIRGLT